ATNQHERVLLEIVANTRDIGCDFDAVCESDARYLAERRVRFLGCLREHADTDAALLRAVLQGGTLRLADDLLAPGTNQLTDSRHTFLDPTTWSLGHRVLGPCSRQT